MNEFEYWTRLFSVESVCIIGFGYMRVFLCCKCFAHLLKINEMKKKKKLTQKSIDFIIPVHKGLVFIPNSNEEFMS